jgi:hypothetical protein
LDCGRRKDAATETSDSSLLRLVSVLIYIRVLYRRVVALLNDSGMVIGKDRVQRIWRHEGFKVSPKAADPVSPLAR